MEEKLENEINNFNLWSNESKKFMLQNIIDLLIELETSIQETQIQLEDSILYQDYRTYIQHKIRLKSYIRYYKFNYSLYENLCSSI